MALGDHRSFGRRSHAGALEARARAPDRSRFNSTFPRGAGRCEPGKPDPHSGFNSRSRSGSDDSDGSPSVSVSQVPTYAPAQGATSRPDDRGRDRVLVSTQRSRGGSDRRGSPQCAGGRGFQPTFLRRRRPVDITIDPLTAWPFQPTLPRRERRHDRVGQAQPGDVSTHAPRQGATRGCDVAA